MDSFQQTMAVAGMVADGRNTLFHLRYMIERGGMPTGYSAEMLRKCVEAVKGEADSLMVKLGEVE